MTSEGLGKMFEGDFADTSSGKFPLTSMGGSEDPHRRERKFKSEIWLSLERENPKVLFH